MENFNERIKNLRVEDDAPRPFYAKPQPDCDGILEEVQGYYPKPDKPTRVKKEDKIDLKVDFPNKIFEMSINGN